MSKSIDILKKLVNDKCPECPEYFLNYEDKSMHQFGHILDRYTNMKVSLGIQKKLYKKFIGIDK